jgi:hypothetical protein
MAFSKKPPQARDKRHAKLVDRNLTPWTWLVALVKWNSYLLLIWGKSVRTGTGEQAKNGRTD